jgi:hypothetical protein
MKTKFTLILSCLALLTILMPAEIAQAKKNGTLPENSNGRNSPKNVGGNNGGNQKHVSEVKIRLAAAPELKGAKGSARSQVRSDRQELQVEAQVSRSLAGSVLGVTIGDTVVGTMTVDAFGKAELEISTETGDIIPVIKAGSLIGVVTGAGAIVLAGTF